MRYFKQAYNGYILTIGTGNVGIEITEEQYNRILAVIRNKPARTDVTDYLLLEDLTWEPFEVEPPDPDPELNDTEALNIILGESEVDHG